MRSIQFMASELEVDPASIWIYGKDETGTLVLLPPYNAKALEMLQRLFGWHRPARLAGA